MEDTITITNSIILASVASGFTILGIAIGAILNHFLEKKRRKEDRLFEKRVDIYSKINIALNNSFADQIDVSVIDSIFLHKLRIAMITLLGAGRLVASKELEKKFREYYDLNLESWEKHNENSEESKTLFIKVNQLTVEIESLMRQELGVRK